MNAETTRALKAVIDLLRIREEQYRLGFSSAKSETMGEAVAIVTAYRNGMADEYTNTIEAEAEKDEDIH